MRRKDLLAAVKLLQVKPASISRFHIDSYASFALGAHFAQNDEAQLFVFLKVSEAFMTCRFVIKTARCGRFCACAQAHFTTLLCVCLKRASRGPRSTSRIGFACAALDCMEHRC